MWQTGRAMNKIPDNLLFKIEVMSVKHGTVTLSIFFRGEKFLHFTDLVKVRAGDVVNIIQSDSTSDEIVRVPHVFNFESEEDDA